MPTEIKNWLIQAESDYETAKILHENKKLSAATFFVIKLVRKH